MSANRLYLGIFASFPRLLVFAFICLCLGLIITLANRFTCSVGDTYLLAYRHLDYGVELFSLNRDMVWEIPIRWGDSGFRLSEDGEAVYFNTVQRYSSDVGMIDIDGRNRRNISNDGLSLESLPFNGGTLMLYGNFNTLSQWEFADIRIFWFDSQNSVTLLGNTQVNIPYGWSPDNNWIVYSSYHGGGSDLFVLKIDNYERYQITFQNGYERSASWSPDGESIAYVHIIDARSILYLISVENGGSTALTANLNRSDYPVWLSDRQILFQSNMSFTQQSDWDIYIVSRDGQNLAPLISNFGSSETLGAISPDGRILAYESNKRDNRYPDIYLYNMETGNECLLLEHAYVAGWS